MSLGLVRDVLNSKPFQLADMTQAVNDIIPYKPGQVGALGLFQEEGLFTDVAYIEERQGVLSLIPTTMRGAPSTQIKPVKRKLRPTSTFRLSVEDQINASELFRVTQFHAPQALENLATVRNQRLGIMADAMDMTDEHQKLNCLKGLIPDVDGSTLIDIFALFGVTQDAEYALDLGNSTQGNLAKVLAGIKRQTLNDLEADAGRVDHLHVLCNSTTFDALLQNVDILKWAQVPPNSNYLQESRVFGTFRWQGFVFEEYRVGTIASAVTGGSWVDTDKAIIFPVGPSIYTSFYSPGEFFQVLGTQGIPRYARAAADMEFDEYIKLKLQSYPLHICSRPKVLKKARKGS